MMEHTPQEFWPVLLARETGGHAQAHGANHDTSLDGMTTQTCLTKICLEVLSERFETEHADMPRLSRTQQTAASLLQAVVLRSTSTANIEAGLQSQIFNALSRSIGKANHPLQVFLINLVSVWLKRRLSDSTRNSNASHPRMSSGDHSRQKNLSSDRVDQDEPPALPAVPPPLLFDCLLEGLASAGSQPVLSHWIRFLDTCLPFYLSNIFQILMPLSDQFVKILESMFKDLEQSFNRPDVQSTATKEPVNMFIEMLNGFENVLAQAHDRLSETEISHANFKTPEQPQGFFNKFGSGVFPSDAHRSRSTTANNRLTVLLCFKDAVKLCVRVWSWGADGSENASRHPEFSSSFSHTSHRLKNRARRLLEHVFAAESLECLETLIDSWSGPPKAHNAGVPSSVTLNLLHVLDGFRPRNTVPAIFNALYSRTNPSALDPDRKSTLTSELSDVEIAQFLVHYTRSLEDDAMDEIWTDCITFLKDVLANPLPHRQVLPQLLEFTALLGIKVDNTNFGESRRRRRELAVSIV